METVYATYRQVIARMKRGDMPHIIYQNSAFDDGTRIKSAVMTRIRKQGIATWGKNGRWHLCEGSPCRAAQ